MSKPVINLITPPDKLYTKELSFLLVNPSDGIKSQFNDIFKTYQKSVNLYLMEEQHDENVDWCIEVCNLVDYVIVDIDNTHHLTWLIGYLLSFDKTYYLTKDMQMPYNILNGNRIHDVKQFAEGVDYFAKSRPQT
ncbi:MAG: hypothetical protein CMA31_01910 [Euryarchaeota archaeon]|jgi:hypothetical protein|nr:hypothetical protein [Euryarchaeota archaeon]